MVNGDTLFCAGFGYTANAFSMRLKGQGWTIIGTTRDRDKAARMSAAGIEPLILTRSEQDQEIIAEALLRSTAMLISMAPTTDGCPALPLIQQASPHLQSLQWVGYLSSNGIYGDHGGAWVGEETIAQTPSERGKRRLGAEAAWLGFGRQYGLPVMIFRLPGIYGPGRSALDKVRGATAKRIIKPGQVFNRMHVDDIAQALEKSLTAKTRYRVFNLCDDEPSPSQDVITYAAQLLGIAPPQPVPLEEAGLSAQAKSFYGDNKRVRNNRMKAALGVELEYPTYREGLAAIYRL